MPSDEEIYEDFEKKKEKKGFFAKIFRPREEVLDDRLKSERAKYEQQSKIYSKQQELDDLRKRREAITPPSKVGSFLKSKLQDLKQSSDTYRGDSKIPQKRNNYGRVINVKNVQQVYSTERQLGSQSEFSGGRSFGSGFAIDRPLGQNQYGGYLIDQPAPSQYRKEKPYRNPFRKLI